MCGSSQGGGGREDESAPGGRGEARPRWPPWGTRPCPCRGHPAGPPRSGTLREDLPSWLLPAHAAITLPRRESDRRTPGGRSQQPRWDAWGLPMPLSSPLRLRPGLCQRLGEWPEHSGGPVPPFHGAQRDRGCCSAPGSPPRPSRSTAEGWRWKGSGETASGCALSTNTKLGVWQKEATPASAFSVVRRRCSGWQCEGGAGEGGGSQRQQALR